MTGELRGEPLSCYTTSLVGYLGRDDPHAASALAASIRLAVRTDAPDGQVAFSHHPRIDRVGGWELGYASAPDWAGAVDGIAAELAARWAALVVADTGALPWSPAYGGTGAPHWLLVTDRGPDGWHVVDLFEALLPTGEQVPHAGWVDDRTLAGYLRPAEPAPPLARRDALALGTAVPCPQDGYRWLLRVPAVVEPLAAPDVGEWLMDTATALRWLAERLATDPQALADCADDLWAAARHHAFALRHPVRALDGDAEQRETAAALWGELPRAVRFAAESARRGRPRPGLLATTMHRLADATESLDRSAPLGRTHA